MHKYQVASKQASLLVVAVVVAILASCNPAKGPQIGIHWRSPKPEVRRGTPLVYKSITIGSVEELDTAKGGYFVKARLFRKYAHYVRDETTFLVLSAKGDKTFIDVRPLRKAAPVAGEGEIFTGSESEIEAGVRALTTDWKRTTTLAAVSIGVIVLLLFLTKLFFKSWALLACIAGGAASAYYLAPLFDQRIRLLLPETVRTDLIAYAAAFLAGYIVVNVVIGILFRPLRRKG